MRQGKQVPLEAFSVVSILVLLIRLTISTSWTKYSLRNVQQRDEADLVPLAASPRSSQGSLSRTY